MFLSLSVLSLFYLSKFSFLDLIFETFNARTLCYTKIQSWKNGFSQTKSINCGRTTRNYRWICIVCGLLADKTAAICCRWWNKCSLWFHCTRSRPTWISNSQKLSHNNLQFPPFYFLKSFKTNNTPFIDRENKK